MALTDADAYTLKQGCSSGISADPRYATRTPWSAAERAAAWFAAASSASRAALGSPSRSAPSSVVSDRGVAPPAFVLDGEAGIGKTTLWRAGLALAAEGGHKVLRQSIELGRQALRLGHDARTGAGQSAATAP